MATKRHKKHKGCGSAWQEAEAAGFDMSLVEENLKMTPVARAKQHHRALNLALQLRAAVKARHGGI
jgi:hypothetical protein